MKKGKKSSPKSSPKKGRKRFHDDDDDSDLASVEEKLLPWHYVNPALPLVVEFDELDEQETALLLAMSRWVELGERPANALWAAVRQHGNRPHSYLRYAFGNQEDYDKMRDPRAIFVRCRAAVPHVISANLFARIGLVLLRFCDPSKGDETVNALWEACRTGLPPSPELRSAMELLASMDSAAPLVREFCREVRIIMATPTLFPDGFFALQFPDMHRFMGKSRVSLPIEELLIDSIKDEDLSCGLFDFADAHQEIVSKALEWLLNSSAHHWYYHHPAKSLGWPALKILRNLIQMALASGASTPLSVVVAVASSSLYAKYLNSVAEGIGDEMRQILCEACKHPNVTTADLDQTVRKLISLNRMCIRLPHVGILRILFECGASTLLRDEKGFLLITNIRGGVFFPLASDETSYRSFYYFPYVRAPTTTNMGEQIKFESLDVQQGLIETINSFGANWNRKTHHLFPRPFRERIFCFLMCNRRFRREGFPWLPRDPLEIVIKMIATDDLIHEDQQVQETKALLALTYQDLSTKELVLRCKQVDRDAGLEEPTVSWRRPRRRAKGTFELPYEKYCQRKNVSMVRQATSLPREFFIEFLVLFEMGQQR